MDSMFDALIAKSLAGSGGGGGGGTTNYNALDNRPAINDVTLEGNLSTADLQITAASVGALPDTTKYAASSTAGGSASSAVKLDNAADAGATNQPVYFSSGKPAAIAYEINASVPADAVFTDTTYESKTAASGGTAVSLVTTGEKYTWNNKSDLALGTTATTAAAGNHTHTLSIATDAGTSQISLASNTKYKLTGGGETYVFTTPVDTTYTFDGTYSASTNKAATVSTVTNAINALDVTGASGISAAKTISAWSETDGKVSVSTQDIAITGTQAVLTGYQKSTTAGQAVAATDNVNQAIGKVEKRVEDNENNILLNTNEIATLREITNCKLYGVRIDKQDTNPDTRVTYMYDAVGMTPAYMDFTGGSFNYGSWADIWFVKNNRPVALKFDGTVDYELSHTDFTKKIDGETASDVSDSTYNGNFMSEIPLVYVKRWEDTRYNYIVFSETKPNDDYLAQAHTNANGTVNPYIYLPMFKGWKDSNNKLRSLMGTYPTGNTTGANEVTYAENCGNGWQIWDKAKIDLIMDLIVLITKSTNCRGKIGNGDCQTYNASDTTNYGKMKSGYETDGTTRSANAQFYGSEGTDSTNYGKHHMIAFYIEDLWANRWDRCLGFNLVDNVYKVKMVAPYALDTDSSYTTLTGITPPSATEGYLKNVSSGVYGDVPTEVGASSTTGFANYFYKNASGNRLSLFGGGCAYGLKVGRYWYLNNSSTSADWGIGGSPCFNAL